MKITKSKKLAPATPELAALLARITSKSDEDLPEVLDSISEWCWPRGDLHYWIGTLNRFDSILEKIVKDYEITKVQTNEFTPLCKKLLLSVLRFSRLLIENCTNRKLYASYEHLNNLLLTRDIDVLEATLRFILRPAQQRNTSSHSSRSDLNISRSRLATLAVIWPSTRGASDMVALSQEGTVVPNEAKAVHFSFYRPSAPSAQKEDENTQPEATGGTATAASVQTPARPSRSRLGQTGGAPVTPANPPAGSSSSAQRSAGAQAHQASTSNGAAENGSEGLVVVDIPASEFASGAGTMDIFANAIERFSVPESEQFELFQRIRVSMGLHDLKTRRQMISCRLLAIACYAHLVSEHSANSQLFLYERELITKTASIIEPDNHVPQEVKAAAVYALDAIGRYRSKLAAVLNSVQAAVSHGVMVRVLRELVDELSQPDPKTVDIYVDSVFGFVAFASSIPASTGNGMAMSSAVLPLLVRLVATPDPDAYMVQRTITRAVGLIDSIISTQQNAYATYTAARGVETLVTRVHAEVERDIRDFRNAERQPLPIPDTGGEDSPYGTMSFGRASLLRHLLKSIHHDLQGAGTPDSLRLMLDSTLLHDVKSIMTERKTFGPQIFALAINIMASFVHNEPTALSTIQEHKMPELFLDCVESYVEAHFEVIIAIPNAIGALSLNQAGLDMFASRPMIGKLLSLFTSERHIKVLQDEESAASFGSSIDELVRHQPSMKDAVFAGISSIFDRIQEEGKNYVVPASQRPYYELLGPQSAATTSAPAPATADVEMNGAGPSTAPAPVDLDSTSNSSGNASPAAQEEESAPLPPGAPRTSEEHRVLSYIKAMARFLEMLFQTPHHCKDFLKSDGLTKLLAIFNLPCLPADFYNHLAGDAVVQLIRLIADASPNAVFQALFKDIKSAIEAVPLNFRVDSPGPSQLIPTINATDDAQVAKNNDMYRKSIGLSVRVHLLADCLHTYNVPGHKLPSGLLSSLFSFEPKSLELLDMGHQFRFWTWEYLQLSAAKAERIAQQQASKGDASSSQAGSGGEGPSFQAGTSANGAVATSSDAGKVDTDNDDIPEEAIDSPSSMKKPLGSGHFSADPEITNLDVWQEMSGAISTTIRDFFQELTRLLSPRRSSEASSLRRYAPNALEKVAQAVVSYYKWCEQLHGHGDFVEIGYATTVLRLTMSLLYDERSSSASRAQTQLIWQFAQLDGFQSLFRLYDRFSAELTKHFEDEKPDQSGHIKHALKFHHICGALRILLSLFQNMVTSKLLRESSHTAQLLQKEVPKSSPNYFEPADFLVKIRSQVLTVMNATTMSKWLPHLPVSVNRLVIQIMLEILRADGETPVVTNKDETQAPADRFASTLLNAMNPATALRRATAAATASDAQISQLADMGFPRNAARHALLRTNNDINAATEYLIMHPDIVQSMPDSPAGANPSTSAGTGESPPDAEADPSSSATAEADVAMEEAPTSEAGPSRMSLASASASSSKAPERKVEDKNQPFTDAGMAAKEKLDREREEMKRFIFQRSLDLANHHEDLVFEVRDAFNLISSDKGRASECIQSVIGIILSAGPAAFVEHEKHVAVRLRALAVIFNDDKLIKTVDDETIEGAMGLSMMLIQEYDTRPNKETHPAWFASNLLLVAPLLSLEFDIVKPQNPEITEEERGPVPNHEILPKFDKFAEERPKLLQYCLDMLRQPAALKREGLLAVFRILVHLTRRRSAAADFVKGGGLPLLFQPFRSIAATELSQCQAQTLIILRNVVEDAEALRVTMEQEVQAWMSLGRTKSADISTMTRQLSHVITRDPEMFLAVAKDRFEMTEWSALKNNGSVRFVQPEQPAAAQVKAIGLADTHDADASFGGPASPTKGAHDIDMDASMHEMGAERTDAKPQAVSEAAESVIYFLFSELHKATKDAAICRNIVAQSSKIAAATNTSTATKSTPAPPASSTANGLFSTTITSTASEEAPKPEDAATTAEKAQQNSNYLFACFLMQTLMELLSSYMSCKLAFVSICRRRSATGMDGHSQPRLKLSMLQYFISELIPAGMIRTKDNEELRKRMAQTNLAMSVLVALTADVALNTSVKETPQDLVGVRRFVLDGVIKALRDAATSTETTEIKYGRIYAQADLCYRLLTARPNVSAGKPAYDATLHMAKTMLEKHFVTVLTSTLGEIDLKTPTVKPLLDTILRPLEHLTKAAIKMGKAERKAKEDGHETDEDMSEEDSETDSELLDALEEEALLERDQRQETPDFYRNSSLGMHTGEMEQQPSYTDEEMEDEDEMDEDDVDMGEYDSDEDGSDLSSEEGEEVHTDEMSEDDLSDEDSDEEDDEDDEMDDDDDEVDGEDDESWATEDEDQEEAEDDPEGALDFVDGEGEDPDDVGESALMGEFMGEVPVPHGIMDPAAMEGEGDDGETDEDALSAEEPYDIDELAHLEFADEVAAAVGRGQADDRFGANWGWATIPPQQVGRDSGGAHAHMHGSSSRSRRRLALLDQALHGGHRAATTAENAASHPLLEQAPVVNAGSRGPHSHRNSRRIFGGYDGRFDADAAFTHSFEEMMGSGTMQFLENLVGFAPSDANIQIDVSGGPGGVGSFRVNADSSVLEQLFGRDPRVSALAVPRTAPKQEDPVALAQQFNPLPTGQRWNEAARIVHGTEALERSQHIQGHIINTLFPAYMRYKEEEERKREEDQERRRKNLEAKAEAKANKEKALQSATPTAAEASASSSTASTAAPSSSALSAAIGEASASSGAIASVPSVPDQSTESQTLSQAEQSESHDVEMEDGEQGQGATTPRASTPRPMETAAPSSSTGATDANPSTSTSAPAESSLSASASTSTAPASQERQYIHIHGQRIDITDTGIDPSFLEALPDDMREEVLNQHFRERRAAATAAAAANSGIAPEFLDALPPEIRAEVIQQEAMENARRQAAEANAANGNANEDDGQDEEDGGDEGDEEERDQAVDPAALLASLNPALRNSMLIDNPEDILAGLQNGLLGGIGGARRRHHTHHRGAAAADAGAAAKKAAPRDSIQLLDKGGVATLIRLFFFPDMNGRKNGLYNILSNLSENSKTRADLLSLLLSVLTDGTTDAAAVDKSFSSMSIRASRTAAVSASITPGRPTPKRSASGVLNGTPGAAGPNPLLTNATTAPISVIGAEAPFLIATRVLESLLHLTTVNEQAATFFLKDDARLAKKTGKGKDKEKADSGPAKAAGTAPLNSLLLLLKREDILANAQLVDALLAVLNTVTKPLVTLQAKKAEADATAAAAADATASNMASTAAASTSAGDSTPQTATAAPAAPSATAPAPSAAEAASSAAAATGGDASVPTSESLEAPPQIAADRLAAVVSPLATPISSKGFQHTLSVASHLASIDGARDTIGSALKTEAESASKRLIAELDRLLESLPVKPIQSASAPSGESDMDTTADARPANAQPTVAGGAAGIDAASADVETKFDSPALTALASPASAQAVFLRSLRALDYLMTGR
ncbi:hypothetical protein V8E36_002121 [Tilletia maclaganii]